MSEGSSPAFGWRATSGTLYATQGLGWTGPVVDPHSGGPASSNSAVFRLVSTEHDFGDVRVSLRFRFAAPSHVADAAESAFDGIHLWLRYQSPAEVYAVSLTRRDGLLVVKRKAAGGPSNGGTYTTLGRTDLVVAALAWHSAEATAVDEDDGVRITLSLDGQEVFDVLDSEPGRLSLPGAVGLRGDNTEFWFSDFVACALGG
ncbi:MAG: hypothetical protein U0Q14_09820 [Dermatophilaceae bacterium]